MPSSPQSGPFARENSNLGATRNSPALACDYQPTNGTRAPVASTTEAHARKQCPAPEVPRRSPDTLATETLTRLHALRELRLPARQRALFLGVGFVASMAGFIGVGNLILVRFYEAATAGEAVLFLACFVGIFRGGIVVYCRFASRIETCLKPFDEIAVAKERGELCDQCEYPLAGLSAPPLPRVW